ncbi:MAG: F0F1 ATP synthase subunit B [Chloroflexota bacterium]
MHRSLIASTDLVSVDWSLVAEAIAFLILLYILTRLLYTPLTTAMTARAERIRSGLSAAEDAAKAAQEAQARTEVQLEEARTQAQDIMRQAVTTANSLREQMVAEARTEAQRVIDRGKAEIERERQATIDELRRLVAGVALEAATRVVERSLDSADNRRLVDEAIAQSSAFATAGRA